MKLLIFNISLIFMFGCATIPSEKCETTDWHKAGIHDALLGHFENYFLNHENSCQKNMPPQAKDLYLNGWKEGQAQFCTAEGGYKAGLKGGAFTSFCPENKYPEFFTQFKLGHRVSELLAQKNDLHKQIEKSSNDKSTLTDIAKAYSILSGQSPHKEIEDKIEVINEKISAIDNNAPGGPQVAQQSSLNSISDLTSLLSDRNTINLIGSFYGTIFGFGIGHAIQGRYSESGWKWTLGEVAAIGSLAIASNHACGDRVDSIIRDTSGTLQRQTVCSNNGPNPEFVPIALITWLGFRVWQTYDLFSYSPDKYSSSIYILPNGISLVMQF